jgi:hypothetical protein
MFKFLGHSSTILIIGFKQPNGDVLGLPIGGKKTNNHCKNIMGPFGHP